MPRKTKTPIPSTVSMNLRPDDPADRELWEAITRYRREHGGISLSLFLREAARAKVEADDD